MKETQEVLSSKLEDWPPLTSAYRRLFDELASGLYEVRSVYEHYCLKGGVPDKKKPTIVLRIDVDSAFHLSWPLALHLRKRNLSATHYFLTRPKRYYNIWCSSIPAKIHALGQEVGLHTDHYYEQLAFGLDGLSELKADIQKLSELIGEPIKGMVYHGHPAIDALGVTNWDLSKEIPSSELDLEYHDGLCSCYIQPGNMQWAPKCDARISDFMGISYSWGWNYLPRYPVQQLKKYAKPNSAFHIAFHTKNPFMYWLKWPDCYDETPVPKESLYTFQKKKSIICYNLFKGSLVSSLPDTWRCRIKKMIGRN